MQYDNQGVASLIAASFATVVVIPSSIIISCPEA